LTLALVVLKGWLDHVLISLQFAMQAMTMCLCHESPSRDRSNDFQQNVLTKIFTFHSSAYYRQT